MQGIWKKKISDGITNLSDIASLSKTSGTHRCGQNYECVLTADSKTLKLFKWPCLKGSKGRNYKGHSSHIQSVRFSSRDSTVVSAGGTDCAVFQVTVSLFKKIIL